MRTFHRFFLGGLLAAGLASVAGAQPVTPPAPAASPPMTAASRQVPTRNAAVTAAENAKEPGAQRPEERVIPQISLPLARRAGATAAAAASAPTATPPGAVNDAAARCLAAPSAAEKAACERRAAASSPAPQR